MQDSARNGEVPKAGLNRVGQACDSFLIILWQSYDTHYKACSSTCACVFSHSMQRLQLEQSQHTEANVVSHAADVVCVQKQASLRSETHCFMYSAFCP